MFLVLSLLSLVAAPIAAHVTLVPLARPVLRLQHVSAIPTHPLEPFLSAPNHTTAPYPLQQTTPPSESRPPATPTARPPFLSREPDLTTSPPTPATPYPTPHTLFRPETTSAPPNHCHTIPHPQPNNTYFHIPVLIYPFIHAPRTKNRNHARSTHKTPDLVLQDFHAPGSFTLIDIKIVDPSAASYVSATAKSALHRHRALEAAGPRDYFGPSRRPPPGARMRVVTFVCSTFGSLGAQAQDLMSSSKI